MYAELLFTDSAFPKKRQGERLEERVDGILDYLYMLREQLGYAMSHLEKENFNESGIEDLREYINRPLLTEIGKSEEQLLSLRAEADALSLRIENAEGSIASFGVFAGESEAMIRAVVKGNSTEGYKADAELILAAVNGQSEASLRADKIDFSAASLTFASYGGGAYLSLSQGELMIDSENFILTNSGELYCSSVHISGGSINIGNDGGDTVFCVTETGKVQTRGQIGLVGNGNAEITFLNLSSNVIGSLSYSYRINEADYALYLKTYGSNPLKLWSAAGSSFDGSGKVYIGTASAPGVDIGREGADIHLVGNVYVNGVRI